MPENHSSERRTLYSRTWRWLAGVVVAAISVLVLYEAAKYTSSAEANWPLEPSNSDHPIGNTFGELIEFRVRDPSDNSVSRLKYLQHNGLDILAEPCCENSAPDVVVTAGGKVKLWDISPNDNYSSVEVATTENGHEYVYTYTHLEVPPQASSYQTYAQNGAIGAGTPISMVRDAFPCGYNHLHYGVAKDSLATNPLEKIVPEPDDQEPEIVKLFLVRHGSNPPSEYSVVNSCLTVSGAADVVVEFGDKDAANSAALAAGSLGIYDLKWRACPASDPDCEWNDTHTYDSMEPAWSSVNDDSIKQRFSLVEPLRTIREEWSDVPGTWTGPPVDCNALPVPRTLMFAARDGAASWDTLEEVNGAKKYKDGEYVLSVKAIDYARNEHIVPIDVCVDNPGS